MHSRCRAWLTKSAQLALIFVFFICFIFLVVVGVIRMIDDVQKNLAEVSIDPVTGFQRMNNTIKMKYLKKL